MQAESEVIYRLNDRDQVCFTNAAYDAFAEENRGGHVASRAVLHRSLWDFIGDPTTQQLYREAVRLARAGRRVRFRFRCDSPASRRLMEVDIAHDAKGDVEFRVRTIAEEARTPQTLLDAATRRADELLRVCGWCKKVHVGDEWLEIEGAVKRLRLFERAELPAVTHGICEQCYRTALASLQDSDRQYRAQTESPIDRPDRSEGV